MTLAVHSHVRGSALDAPVGHQGPVVPLAASECTLPAFLVDLHLKRLHVRLIVLVGCEAHPCDRHSQRVRHECSVHVSLSVSVVFSPC